MKVGCQLIVFGDEMREDPDRVLGEIAAAGYDGIEGGAVAEWIGVAELHKLLQKHDLEYVGLHTGFQGLEEISSLIGQVKELRGSFLICSGVSDMESLQGYERSAAAFNDVGKEVARAGLTFAYHNHSWEFNVFDGVAGIDRLYELTDPTTVKLCIDTYWVYDGQRAPADFIRKHAKRVAFLHLKDRKDDTYAEVGEGILNWAEIIDAAKEAKVEWLVVEQDETKRTPAESAAMSRQYLQTEFAL